MAEISNIGIAPDDLVTLLSSQSDSRLCGIYLHKLDALQRQSLYHELETERLKRKCGDIKSIFQSTNHDWAQVMLIIFMRALSDEANRENYMEIANRVNFNTLLREKSDPRSVEMLLVGASGLLDRLQQSDFVKAYRERAEYLLHKYNIAPLPAKAWSERGVIITKMPILRLSQVAMLINNHDQLFNAMVHCTSRDDLFSLFNVQASDEWYSHFGCTSKYRIGRTKIDLIGINLIVPLLYTYGFYINDDDIITTANDLNESLPAEYNRYIRHWRDMGLNPLSAFESQALIQLSKEYCDPRRCRECHILHHMLSCKSVLNELPEILYHR